LNQLDEGHLRFSVTDEVRPKQIHIVSADRLLYRLLPKHAPQHLLVLLVMVFGSAGNLLLDV
jgi:hypothetical protein